MTPGEIERLRSHFAATGLTKVRMMLSDNRYNHEIGRIAIQWISEQDQEAELFNKASQAEMESTASRAAAAAERAATAAESQARTAAEALLIAKQALTSARVATAIAAIALMTSIIAAFHILR